MIEDTSAATRRLGRNIVICADGTGNAYVGRASNAARIIDLLAMDCPERQVVAYDQGIGTDARNWKELKRRATIEPDLKNLKVLPGPHQSWFPPSTWWRLVGGLAIGVGLRENVQQMYEWLAARYRGENDRVYLFGFSRGAFTVRALAGLIFRCGLSDKGGAFATAWRLYEPMKSDRASVDAFWREAQPRRCPIHFLGLWDTVKSYGGLRPVMLPHLRHNPTVGTVCHAMALDEHRGWFDATSWGWLDHDQGLDVAPESKGFAAARLDTDSKRALSKQVITEVWFTGSHSDVGGGNGNDATSDIALTWILAEAVHSEVALSDAGVRFLRRYTGREIPTVTDSHTRLWRLVERVPRWAIDNDGEWPTTIEGVVGPADRKSSTLLRAGRAAFHTTALTKSSGVDIRLVGTRRDSALALVGVALGSP